MTSPISQQVSAGGVIVRRAQGRCEVCLILRDRHGRAWGLPKGHVEAGEDPAATAMREVREETGLMGEILHPLDTIAYQFREPERGHRVAKTVHFFLMCSTGGRLDDHDAETVEARWLPLDEAVATVTYENERRVLEQAKQLLARPEVARRLAE